MKAKKSNPFRRLAALLVRVTGSLTGFNPVKLFYGIRGILPFLADARRYSRMSPRPSMRIQWRFLFPIFDERFEAAGSARGQYFHQDLWAARLIYKRSPQDHIDIGSRIDGFIAHLLTFRSVTIIDIRDMPHLVSGLSFVRDDATKLSGFGDNSIDSLSSLHVAEHFGLGRYSDPVDPEATFLFMQSLQRVLRPGGRLYFSVPIGRERVEFNAHRIFDVKTILSTFGGLELVSFSYIGDDGDLYEGASPDSVPPMNLGCGLFEFTKSAQMA